MHFVNYDFFYLFILLLQLLLICLVNIIYANPISVLKFYKKFEFSSIFRIQSRISIFLKILATSAFFHTNNYCSFSCVSKWNCSYSFLYYIIYKLYTAKSRLSRINENPLYRSSKIWRFTLQWKIIVMYICKTIWVIFFSNYFMLL